MSQQQNKIIRLHQRAYWPEQAMMLIIAKPATEGAVYVRQISGSDRLVGAMFQVMMSKLRLL